jgi:hypothetical protein
MGSDSASNRPPLDDLMLAMDVVDTLRHDERIALRELNSDDRDQAMLERLREIYKSQGIEVSERILAEGVESLKENRFVYSPPPLGISRTLATIYVTRARWGRVLLIVLLLLLAAFLAWRFLVVAPRERAAEELRIELSQTLPQSYTELEQRIARIATVPEADEQAQAIAADGRAAAARGDAAAARAAQARLQALEARLLETYQVRVVSRPGTPTGVTRIPQANRETRNYYLVVEAIGPDGTPLSREVTSEEDGEARTVTIWAQRVPSATFDTVRRDKEDDGIVQNAVLGEKRRGALEPDWTMPVDSGAITRW